MSLLSVGTTLGLRQASSSQWVGRFEAGLDIVRRLLAGESVTTDPDAPWPVAEAVCSPQPPEPVEVWIGAGAPAAIDRAARMGNGWLAGPGGTPAQAEGQLGHYLARCQAYGREPSAIAIRRDIHVGRDRDDAERVAGPVLAGGYRGFSPEATVTGGPEQVAKQFHRLAAMGFTDVIVRHLVRRPSGRVGLVRPAGRSQTFGTGRLSAQSDSRHKGHRSRRDEF